MSDKTFDFAALEKGWTALWPVRVNVPQDGGKIDVQSFEVRLRLLSIEQINTALQSSDPFALAKAYLVEIPGGPKLTPEFLDKLLTPEWVRLGLQEAYVEFRSGSAAKN